MNINLGIWGFWQTFPARNWAWGLVVSESERVGRPRCRLGKWVGRQLTRPGCRRLPTCPHFCRTWGNSAAIQAICTISSPRSQLFLQTLSEALAQTRNHIFSTRFRNLSTNFQVSRPYAPLQTNACSRLLSPTIILFFAIKYFYFVFLIWFNI